MSAAQSNISDIDQTSINEFKERYSNFIQNLNEKTEKLAKNRLELLQTYQDIKASILSDFNNTTQDKVLQLDNKYNQLTRKFEDALDEASIRKKELDAQISQFEYLIKSLEVVKEKTQFQNDDFFEDDALMINDYDNELNDSHIKSNETKGRLEETGKSIEILMNESLELDNVLSSISNGLIKVHDISLNENSIEQNIADDIIEQESYSTLELIDHTHFKMDTELCENFSFRKNQKCYIQFSYPEIAQIRYADDSKNLHKYLKIELYDSHQNFVSFDIKEKVTHTVHLIRIYFVPLSAGIFKLHIKFKNTEIPQSPFHFVVLAETIQQNGLSNSDTSIASSNFSGATFDGYNLRNDEPVNQNLFKPPIRRSEIETQQKENNTSSNSCVSFNAGRGRLLRMKNQVNSNVGESLFSERSVTVNPVISSLSQKRKSPDNRFDSNNNLIINEEVMDAEESSGFGENSNKLQKLGSIDGSMNRFPAPNITSLFSLNVNTGTNANHFHSNNESSVNILSNHLRRYSNSNGLVRLLDDKQIPPLKAVFQRKFDNLSFPIGVRSCSVRNWLIVCDNGTNTIKIFEKSSGELLRQIHEDPAHGIRFKRPSAILLNERKPEMYVKDDKEIFVFDLEQDCKLLRKFGNGILKKPYGLAYDVYHNLVCVDADFRNPQIHVFNRDTGELIVSKPYNPVMKISSNAHVLSQKFGQKNILANRMEPFEKSKVRFICSNNNYVYASDLGRSIVFKTNMEGEIEMAFGFQGKKRGEFNEPSGIHVDNDGQAILVGDSKNDRLQIYDADGKYKCDVLFSGDKVVRPSDIYIDQEGYLYVSCFIQHCVKKFKLISD